MVVITLTLGLWPKLRNDKRSGLGKCHIFRDVPMVNVEEWISIRFPPWELKSGNVMNHWHQILSKLGFLKKIGKTLKNKYLKWAHISHLNIWNTCYGCIHNPTSQKGRQTIETNNQNWKNIYVLPFKTMEIMASFFLFIHMNVKKFKPKIYLITFLI
jgi:hypothetical protein